MGCLRRVEGVTKRDRIRNKDIFSRLNCQKDVVEKVQQRRMRYFGHISRMDNERYPKIALNGYVHGLRTKGRPKKRWLDTVVKDCQERGLNIHDAARLTGERDEWRKFVEELPLRATASPRP